MNKQGPIVVIEDDEDDRALLTMMFGELNYSNEVVFFEHPVAAFEFLCQKTVMPFLIISDINMPFLNGFELREKIQSDERTCDKCIPYVFMSTALTPEAVSKAYKLNAQGFFHKAPNYKTMKDSVKVLVDYWKTCYSPTTSTSYNAGVK